MSDQGLSIFDEPEGTDGSSSDEEATQVMPAVRADKGPEKPSSGQSEKPAVDEQPTRQAPATSGQGAPSSPAPASRAAQPATVRRPEPTPPASAPAARPVAQPTPP